MDEHEQRIASLRAELSDRAAENHELRQEIARALRLIDKGYIESAKACLKYLTLNVTEEQTS